MPFAHSSSPRFMLVSLKASSLTRFTFRILEVLTGAEWSFRCMVCGVRGVYSLNIYLYGGWEAASGWNKDHHGSIQQCQWDSATGLRVWWEDFRMGWMFSFTMLARVWTYPALRAYIYLGEKGLNTSAKRSLASSSRTLLGSNYLTKMKHS